MTFAHDVSINTFIISVVVALVGYGLKAALWALGEVGKNLISTLITTMGKVEALEADLTKLIAAVGDVQKIRSDLNEFYSRLKKLETTLKIQ